jgi:hypothetical protein
MRESLVHPPKLSCAAGLVVDQERGHGACTHTAWVWLHLAAPGSYKALLLQDRNFSLTL